MHGEQKAALHRRHTCDADCLMQIKFHECPDACFFSLQFIKQNAHKAFESW